MSGNVRSAAFWAAGAYNTYAVLYTNVLREPGPVRRVKRSITLGGEMRTRTGMTVAMLLVASVAVAPAVQAQSGDGFLFGTPDATLTLRAGWSHANAKGDLFDETTSRLTLDKSDFSGPMVGAELAVRMAPRLDLTVDGSWTGRTKNSAYRTLIDNNNMPIEQTTEFIRVPLTLNVKYYLTDRGRSIGRFAYIPSAVTPWLGAGGGLEWYRFRQIGDFVNYTTMDVFNARVESSGWAGAAQAMAGADFTLTPRIALTADARYVLAHAQPSGDFVGFSDPIDLSGLSVGLSFTFRL